MRTASGGLSTMLAIMRTPRPGRSPRPRRAPARRSRAAPVDGVGVHGALAAALDPAHVPGQAGVQNSRGKNWRVLQWAHSWITRRPSLAASQYGWVMRVGCGSGRCTVSMVRLRESGWYCRKTPGRARAPAPARPWAVAARRIPAQLVHRFEQQQHAELPGMVVDRPPPEVLMESPRPAPAGRRPRAALAALAEAQFSSD